MRLGLIQLVPSHQYLAQVKLGVAGAPPVARLAESDRQNRLSQCFGLVEPPFFGQSASPYSLELQRNEGIGAQNPNRPRNRVAQELVGLRGVPFEQARKGNLFHANQALASVGQSDSPKTIQCLLE